jgi:conjugal transfer pilus assembly protein TraB
MNKISEEQKKIKEKLKAQKSMIVAVSKSKANSKRFFAQDKEINQLKLPNLPPLKSNLQKKAPPSSKTSKTAFNGAVRKAKEKTFFSSEVNFSQEYFEESEVAVKESKYSSLRQESKEAKKRKLPTFTLMPGFVKGVLVSGGKVGAFFNGNSEPSPIFIRITGDQLIANDDSVNIDGCLILATGKGDLSKKAVDIRLSEMSCSLTDIDGNYYKIKQKVSGWVFSENGEWGVPGRLITRESEILKAGLPLSLVEGMINTLNNVLNKEYTNTIGGTNYYSLNPQTTNSNAFSQGVNSGTQKILQKFSDYYLKMLDSLNPVIQIRAGREVVIAFKGGEKLKLEKYEPIDTNYFFTEEFRNEK